MANQLSNMQIEEISLVREPASPGADVLLYKSKDSQPNAEELVKELQTLVAKFGIDVDVPKKDAHTDMVSALHKSLEGIATATNLTKSQKTALIKKSVDEFNEALAVLAKGADGSDKGDTAMPDIAKMSVEDKTALLKALKDDKDHETVFKGAGCAPGMKKNENADGTDEPMDGAETTKGKMKKSAAETANEEAVNKALEPLQKQLKEQADQIAAFQKAEDERVRLAKANEMTKGLTGVKAEDVSTVLKGMSEDAVKLLEGVLKSAAEQARLAEVTSVKGAPVHKEGSAMAIAKAKADEIRKAKPELTQEQALTKAFEADPALYDRAESEKRAA